MYSPSDLRKGLKIEIEAQPYVITDFDFCKPGKGQALYRCKLKNLINGSTLDRTYRSADKIDRTHLRKLKSLVKRTKTPWLSDHLCWGSVDGTYTHDLLPMPYTFASARRTAEKIRQVRDFLEVPICVENVSSYAEYHVSEMTEWEFLSEVVERADCGILLDVNNIYVSSQNHGFNPYDYLDGVPHHRVGQMHVAGHTKFEKYILDTHDHPVLDPVWKLYAHATKRCGVTATLLEWDDKIPSFDEVHNEALKAHEFIGDARAARRPARADAAVR
jgi:uncharacterized protein (UPF0276 family)